MSRVLVISHDYVRRAMAGPGIRSFELARQLHNAGHDVVLAVPVSTDIDPQPFRVESWMSGIDGGLLQLSRGQDVILIQGFVLEHNMYLLEAGARLVVDLYDPFHLEYIASHAHDPRANEVPTWSTVLQTLLDQARLGDFFLCASERQRDFWLGMLSALNRVSPATYATDSSLRNLVDVVPFGIPAEPPRKRQAAIRGRVPGIGEKDLVLLWGGGIYNWFDPLTPIRAVARLCPAHPEIKLFFLATRHPSPDVPEMTMAAAAVALAEELGVLDRHVFFSRDWVPYEERGDWLLEADAGISTHQAHLETRFSFRTRILDCFWAGLPVLCTGGDSLGDVVEREGLGVTVPPDDVDAVCGALLRMLDPSERRAQAERVARIAPSFTWENAAAPLVRYCDKPVAAADRPAEGYLGSAVPVPLRSDEERHEMLNPPDPAAPVAARTSIVVRGARVLAREGVPGVLRRVRRRLGPS